MPRKYIRKKEQSYTIESLQKAVQEIKDQKITFRHAEEKYGIPRATLFDQVKKGSVSTIGEIGENLKISLHSAITKRLGILETNKTTAKSTFLDPRYKKAGFGHEANAEKAAQWVIKELESEIIKKNRNLAPDESSQTVNTSSNANASIGTNNKANDLWEDFDKKISERELIQTPTSSAIVIVKQYKEMQYLDRHLEPILFWEQRKKAMPELYELAIKYLYIPASSVPAERVFSKAALICNQRRNRLDSKKVDEIIFLNSYFS